MSEPDSASQSSMVDLTTVGMPRIFFGLLHRRFTGRIEVDQLLPEPGRRTIWVRGGMPIFTNWVSHEDVLGEVLVQQRRLQPGDFNRALQRLAQDGGLLGQHLCNLGVISPEVLADGLREQCRRKLLHTFALREGTANVTAMEEVLPEFPELRHQVNVLALLLLGASSYYDEARIQVEMGQALGGRLLATESLRKYQRSFGFRKGDVSALRALLEGTTLAELARLPDVKQRRAFQLAYVLWACQMLLTGDEARASPTVGESASSPGAPPPVAEPTTGAPSEKTPDPPKPKAEPKPKPKAKPAAKEGDEMRIRSETVTVGERSGVSAEEAAAFEDELRSVEKLIADEANPFDLFGVPLEAGRKDVRRKWAVLSRRFHPDTLEGMGLAHLTDRVEPAFAALSEAYGVLSNKDEREKLVRIIEAGGTGKVGEDANEVVRSALEADMLARDGDKYLRSSNFGRALECYVKAHALGTQDPDVKAALIWCRFNTGSKTNDEGRGALTELEEIISDFPRCTRAHHFAGMVLVAIGSEAQAARHFKSALEVDARFTESERQLRAIRLRQKQRAGQPLGKKKKDDKKKGFKLFGKK